MPNPWRVHNFCFFLSSAPSVSLCRDLLMRSYIGTTYRHYIPVHNYEGAVFLHKTYSVLYMKTNSSEIMIDIRHSLLNNKSINYFITFFACFMVYSPLVYFRDFIRLRAHRARYAYPSLLIACYADRHLGVHYLADLKTFLSIHS